MYGQLCTEFYDADKQFSSAEELELYQKLFSKNDLLLEPMCGSGRLLIPLIQLGYTVHGFDSSSCMLKSCKQRAFELNHEPLLQQNTIENYLSDYQYQGIIIPLGSFQLLYPREMAYQALEKFHQLLAPGGKLVMDLFVPWEAMYEGGKEDTSTRQVKLNSGELIEVHNHTRINKFEQHMLSKIHYTKYSGDKIIAEENEKMDILWYYPFEMELILEKYGFNNIKHVNRVLNGSSHITYIASVIK